MQLVKPAGHRDAARKYDIITALGAYALARNKHDQRLVLRLITLMTARYNWARNELAVGQREIARLWSVDERTVKREMAKLRGCGWLTPAGAPCGATLATCSLFVPAGGPVEGAGVMVVAAGCLAIVMLGHICG